MLAAWIVWIVTCVVAPLCGYLLNLGMFEPLTEANAPLRLMERIGIGAGLPLLAAVWVMWSAWPSIKEARFALGALLLLLIGTGLPFLTVREAFSDLRSGPVVQTVQVEAIRSATVSRYGTFTTMYELVLPGRPPIRCRPGLSKAVPLNRPVELSYLPHQRLLLRAGQTQLKPVIPGLRMFSLAACVLCLGFALFLGLRRSSQSADGSPERTAERAAEAEADWLKRAGALTLAVLFALIALP
jgi:hypothetical protein